MAYGLLIRNTALFVAVLVCGGATSALAAADPVFSDSGPDAASYGAPDYPINPEKRGAELPQKYLVGNYSHFDQVFKTRRVGKADSPSPLRRAPEELALSYSFQGESHTLGDYLERNPATGLLIARGDEILFEHYRYARTDRDRLVGQSMTKTITAMLFGIAVADGKIRSVDAPAADYVPQLAGSEYGKTPLRALLHMASGVTFREDYGGDDDVARLGRALFAPDSLGPAKAVALFNTREAPPDTRFHYASVETELLGLVLATATQSAPADYARGRLWQPMGAEADASWVVDATDREAGFFGFSATLRDWARLGLVLAHDGAWNGRQIIPRQWLIEATTVAPGEEFRAPRNATPYFGYGYQVWIFPGPRRQFALLGIHGQAIFVDPAAQLVLAHTAVRVKPSERAAELVTLWHTLVARVAQ
jgi:CubicO group peptidase (beta-lactamase class C family)